MNASRTLPLALLLTLVPPGPGSALQPDAHAARARGDTLSLPHLLADVAERNPRLRAASAAAVAAGASVAEASTLPDPTLQLGIMNFGLPDFETDMPNSMAPSIQVLQRLPLPGKLRLRGDVAAATGEIAAADAAETWWSVREGAGTLFWELYALDRRIEVMRETLDLLEDFRQIASALYASGEGRQTDVLRADVEVARMSGEIRRLSARRDGTAARLNGLLDRPVGTPIGRPEAPALPRTLPAPDTLARWAERARPLLRRARVEVDRAEAGVDLARREIWPDVTLGVTYGRRSGEAGARHMGSAVVGFSLPVHAGSRQLAARTEALAVRDRAEAILASVAADVRAGIGEQLAELDRARSLLDLYRAEILPQARVTVESALSSYRVGTVDFATLVDAQLSVDRFEEELHLLVADYGAAIIRLESLLGRSLPITRDRLVTTPEIP